MITKYCIKQKQIKRFVSNALFIANVTHHKSININNISWNIWLNFQAIKIDKDQSGIASRLGHVKYTVHNKTISKTVPIHQIKNSAWEPAALVWNENL